VAKKNPAGRRPGRPASALSERVQIRLTPEEVSEWGRLAADRGITLSAWLRQAGHLEARRQK